MLSDQFYNKFIKDWKTTDLVKIGDVFIKLEHQNPTGSIKDRGISLQVYNMLEDGIKRAVITSSGNAAISAAYYTGKAGIELDVFVSKKIPEGKLRRIQKYSNKIHQVSDPLHESAQFASENNVHNMQQSLNENAPEGFKTIVHEIRNQLNEQAIKLSDVAIMMPVSSGTTCVGVLRGLEEVNTHTQVHVAQSTAVHTIVEGLISDLPDRKRSKVSGLVARSTKWKDEVVTSVKTSGGTGWIVDDRLVSKFADYLSSLQIACSLEGALAFAADSVARTEYKDYPKYSVVLLT